MHTYGVVTYVKNNSDDKQVSGSYKYITNGTEGTLNTNSNSFGVSTGQAVKIKSDGREVTSMTPFSKSNATKITEISGSVITMNNNKYTLSDKVQIYVKTSYSSVYSMITLDELAELADQYTAYVYTDKLTSPAGRVRVIILRGN